MREPRTEIMSGNCSVSVIVPTFNRKDLLADLLESLWLQTLSRDTFEVIVVNDGSTDGTEGVTSDFASRAWNLRVISRTNGGPAAARNAGANDAKGKYLAFTDDDCVATPEWLETMLRGFRGTGAVAIQGRTTTLRELRTPLTHEIEVLTPWTSALQTCNAAYLKSAFEQAGGFDESFTHAHNEDADLAWRVEELGEIVFIPEVHVIHPPRPSTFYKQASDVRMLECEFLLYYKQPDKYRRYISSSPWRNIYWTVFVNHQLRFAKRCCGYLVGSFRPRCFLEGVAVLIGRWVALIWYLPMYRRADGFYFRKYGLVPHSVSQGPPVAHAGKEISNP